MALKLKKMFKIGQKVVCIEKAIPSESCLNSPSPIVGQIYTVNWIGTELNDMGFIGLKELNQSECFLSILFIPLDESFAEEALENIKQQIEEEQLILTN